MSGEIRPPEKNEPRWLTLTISGDLTQRPVWLCVRVLNPSASIDAPLLRFAADGVDLPAPVTPLVKRTDGGEFSLEVALPPLAACPRSLGVSGMSFKRLGAPSAVRLSLHDAQGPLSNEADAPFKRKKPPAAQLPQDVPHSPVRSPDVRVYCVCLRVHNLTPPQLPMGGGSSSHSSVDASPEPKKQRTAEDYLPLPDLVRCLRVCERAECGVCV